ncbi:MAG TPA: sugar transferase [Isosphaeraceae bacterium]|jgi:lipopolysaccharide/colanic/teichoic acid biosynthesis glycosyltransferase|nr:sugar transferase [Isosphaeraceae bacterium]
MSGPSPILPVQDLGQAYLGYGLEVDELQRADRAARAATARRRAYLAAKRGIDVVASVAALIALGPVLLVTALLIKLRDGGPVLFVQKRVGKDGRAFDFYKFRSMVVGAERLQADLLAFNHHDSGHTFKMRRDPRVTWIGRLIRRTSIDELPQFLNVLKGDMTLVGPRPALPREVARYDDRDRRRLEVTPGLTCLWQVNGRADLPFDRQVELDLEYIEGQGLLLDLEILARTIPAVLSCRGAY